MAYWILGKVLDTYRITLLSNSRHTLQQVLNVLDTYRITLLSNAIFSNQQGHEVLDTYRITLLSNPQITWTPKVFFHHYTRCNTTHATIP